MLVPDFSSAARFHLHSSPNESEIEVKLFDQFMFIVFDWISLPYFIQTEQIDVQTSLNSCQHVSDISWLKSSVWNGSTLHFELLVRESVKKHRVWPCSQAESLPAPDPWVCMCGAFIVKEPCEASPGQTGAVLAFSTFVVVVRVDFSSGFREASVLRRLFRLLCVSCCFQIPSSCVSQCCMFLSVAARPGDFLTSHCCDPLMQNLPAKLRP